MEDVDFLWGLMSYDDLSSHHEACFDTMNDIELIHWKATDTYSVLVEEAYVFKTPADKLRYLTALEAALTDWMKEQGYRTDTLPEPPTETKGHFRSIEAAYADFIARVKAERNPYPVGPGWWSLLGNYLSQIRAIDPACEVIVKEKYGLLRIRPYKFKDGLLRKDFWPICIEAEKASETVCEICGESGRIRTDRSWWETLCDRCATLNDSERRKVEQETAERYFQRNK